MNQCNLTNKLPTKTEVPTIKSGMSKKIENLVTSNDTSKPKTIPSVNKERQKCTLKTNKKNIKSGIKVPKHKYMSKHEAAQIINANIHAKTLLSESINKTCMKPGKSWLMHTITNLCLRVERTLRPTNLKFEITPEAADHNAAIFRKNHNNLQSVIDENFGSTLTPGSEFRDINAIESIWKYHQDWSKMKTIISDGCNYPMNHTQTPHEREVDLEFMMDYGNHKSALSPEGEAAVYKAYNKEVNRQWMIPIPVDSVKDLKDSGVIPIGCVVQHTIDGKGNRIIKRRVTHDATFEPPSSHSINNDTLEELLDPCIYGTCIRRITHAIHDMRFHHPDVWIFISKTDLDSWYRRLHVVALLAIKAITIVKNMAFILTRLPFGVAAGPAMSSQVSEATFDLTNDILEDPSWDPHALHSPHQDLFKPPEEMDPNIPFGTARKLSVPIPTRTMICDGYIDDCITIGLDINDNVIRIQGASPLAIHAIFKPVDPEADPTLKRDDVFSLRKADGEGTPAEQKPVLGWLLHTRRFRIFLPAEKAMDWISQIDVVLKRGTTTEKEMDSTVGRLNHVGYIIPQGRYFLNRLRYRLKMCKQFGPQKLKLWDIQDLELWKKLLTLTSQEGIDLNHINFIEPTAITVSDACETGIGGFEDNTYGWRYELPSDLQGVFTINLLEFLGSAITVRRSMRRKHRTELKKYLAVTDSSCGTGWLYHSSFSPVNQPCHDHVAREFATNLIENNSSLYPQHLKGKANGASDSLSRDHHIPAKKLELLLKTLFPTQAGPNFRIGQMHKDDVSWLYSLKATLTAPMVSPQPVKRSNLGDLIDGNDSWRTLAVLMNSLLTLSKKKESHSSAHLQDLLDEMSLAQQISLTFDTGRSVPPLATYVRPSGRTFGTTHLLRTQE